MTCGLLALSIAGAGYALAATMGTGVITGCYAKQGGALRLIRSGRRVPTASAGSAGTNAASQDHPGRRDLKARKATQARRDRRARKATPAQPGSRAQPAARVPLVHRGRGRQHLPPTSLR